MTGMRIARGMLLVAGLMFAGCGGTEAGTLEEESALETREDRLDCRNGGFNFRWIYYSDASYSTVIGERICDCLGPYSWGKSSQFVIEHPGTC